MPTTPSHGEKEGKTGSLKSVEGVRRGSTCWAEVACSCLTHEAEPGRKVFTRRFEFGAKVELAEDRPIDGYIPFVGLVTALGKDPVTQIAQFKFASRYASQ